MKLIAAVAMSSLLLMGQSDQTASNQVTAVRHWQSADVTRVAVEITGPFEFRTERLHNPDRVYYDVLKTRPNFDSKRAFVETVSDKMLQKIRVAETIPGVTRVVLDLAGTVEATTTTLTNPYRLIIELRNTPGNPITAAPPVTTSVSSVVTPPIVEPTPPPQRPQPALFKPVPAPIKLAARTPDLPLPNISVPGVSAEPSRLDEASPDAPIGPRSKAPITLEETAKAARHNSDGSNSLIRALGLKINRVVIDPGHGGHDQGTEGAKGLLEKDLVLDVALRVGKLVQERMNAEVIYTRSDDTFIPLEGRTALANEKKADLFLSIHANSSPVARIAGVETYYLNINGTRDAMDVAARENGATQRSIFELQDIIKKITLHDKSEESHEFAKKVEAALFAFNLKSFPANRDRGVKSAPFVVLIGANMPSVLAEIGFVSNSREELLLKRSDYRQKLAEALYKGIEGYTGGLSHFQTAALRP